MAAYFLLLFLLALPLCAQLSPLCHPAWHREELKTTKVKLKGYRYYTDAAILKFEFLYE
jgi:hypothetical protein